MQTSFLTDILLTHCIRLYKSIEYPRPSFSLKHSAGYIINSSQALGTNVHNFLGSTSLPHYQHICVIPQILSLECIFHKHSQGHRSSSFHFSNTFNLVISFHFPTPVTSKSAFLTQPQIILLSCLFFSMSLMYLRLKSLSHKLKELM